MVSFYDIEGRIGDYLVTSDIFKALNVLSDDEIRGILDLPYPAGMRAFNKTGLIRYCVENGTKIRDEAEITLT